MQRRTTLALLTVSTLMLVLTGCFDYDAVYDVRENGKIQVDATVLIDPFLYDRVKQEIQRERRFSESDVEVTFNDDNHSMRFQGVSDTQAKVMEDTDGKTYQIPPFLNSDASEGNESSSFDIDFSDYHYRVRLRMPSTVESTSRGEIDGSKVVIDTDLATAMDMKEITVETEPPGSWISLTLVVIVIAAILVAAIVIFGLIPSLREERST